MCLFPLWLDEVCSIVMDKRTQRMKGRDDRIKDKTDKKAERRRGGGCGDDDAGWD